MPWQFALYLSSRLVWQCPVITDLVSLAAVAKYGTSHRSKHHAKHFIDIAMITGVKSCVHLFSMWLRADKHMIPKSTWPNENSAMACLYRWRQTSAHGSFTTFSWIAVRQQGNKLLGHCSIYEKNRLEHGSPKVSAWSCALGVELLDLKRYTDKGWLETKDKARNYQRHAGHQQLMSPGR